MGKVKEICSDEYRELTIKREFLNEAGHFRVVDTTETNCVICGKGFSDPENHEQGKEIWFHDVGDKNEENGFCYGFCDKCYRHLKKAILNDIVSELRC